MSRDCQGALRIRQGAIVGSSVEGLCSGRAMAQHLLEGKRHGCDLSHAISPALYTAAAAM